MRCAMREHLADVVLHTQPHAFQIDADNSVKILPALVGCNSHRAERACSVEWRMKSSGMKADGKLKPET